MKRVRRAPKDIDLIIYKLIHRDLMKQLNQEYHMKMNVCTCEYDVCKCCTKVTFVKRGVCVWYNYRRINPNHMKYEFIYNKSNTVCGKLPLNY